MTRPRRRTLALLAAFLCGGCVPAHPPGPPDVVLIVIDTLRADHLALYGYEHATSPHLERLAADGVTYLRAISPGTWTVPAHGSLFTGRWPSYHGAERVAGQRMLAYPLNPDVPTLAELLHAGGYATAAFVGNGTYVAPPFGFARGFTTFEHEGLESPPTVARRVDEWLAGQPRPLFLFLNLLDPHEPYEPPAPLDTRFATKQPEFGTMITTVVNERRPLTPAMRRHFVGQYDGEVALSDQALGSILDALRADDRYDDALIVVTSDHGELLGEHGLAGHGVEPYEPELHVPLVVKYPGNRRAGERREQRVSTLAVFGTILATVALPVPAGAESSTLDGPHPVWVEDVNGAGHRVRVGYDGAHKLVDVSAGDAHRRVAYDLDADPEERTAAAVGPAVGALAAALDAFSTAPRPANPAERPIIDAEQAARLRALGYLD